MSAEANPFHITDQIFNDYETGSLLFAAIDERVDELDAKRRAYLGTPKAVVKCAVLEQMRSELIRWADAPYGAFREAIRENLDSAIKAGDKRTILPLRLARREITKWERLAIALG